MLKPITPKNLRFFDEKKENQIDQKQTKKVRKESLKAEKSKFNEEKNFLILSLNRSLLNFISKKSSYSSWQKKRKF